MKIQKRILLFFLILTLFSCKKSEFENLLIKPDKKWVYINDEKINPNLKMLFYMKFEKNGECYNYFLSNNQKSVHVDGHHKQDKWKYSEKDSVLKIQDYYNFKILKFTKDTIYLLDLKYNNKALFVNSESKKKTIKASH